MIAALYVDARGPYASMSDVDAWHAERDAHRYAGPHAVVAHPPCAGWSRLRHLAHKRDIDSAAHAFACVRLFGGVLEQPAHSKMWEAFGAPWPCDADLREVDGAPLHGAQHTDEHGGYTVQLDQCEWGHVARKRTWLYLVGVPRSALEAPPYPGRAPTHWCSGSRGKSSRTGHPVPPGIKVCSAEQRNRTPPEFAAYLVRLARTVRP
jgi:hypothetical protein